MFSWDPLEAISDNHDASVADSSNKECQVAAVIGRFERCIDIHSEGTRVSKGIIPLNNQFMVLLKCRVLNSRESVDCRDVSTAFPPQIY